MHVGRRYKFTQFLGWTGREAAYLIGWSLLVTVILQFSGWNFLTVPAPILTIIGSALAIILAFKNQQCYARFNEALALSGQVTTNSLILANRLMSTVGNLNAAQSGPALKEIFYRHFAWLTALRFFCATETLGKHGRGRQRQVHGQASHPGKPIQPQGRAGEISAGCRVAEDHGASRRQGGLILSRQYEAIRDLYSKKLISEYWLTY